MGQGQGSITTNQRTIPGGGGGGIAGAKNGLTVVGTDVELGGANPLIQDTSIISAGFNFDIGPAGQPNFLIWPGFGLYAFGDPFGAGNGFNLFINDASERVAINAGSTPYLVIDQASDSYTFGDSSSNQGGTYLDLESGFAGLYNGPSSAPGLFLDWSNGQYSLGDSSGNAGNFTAIYVDDANTYAEVGLGGLYNRPGLIIDFASGYYALGDDYGFGNGCEIVVQDNNNRIVGGVLENGALGTNFFVQGDPINQYGFQESAGGNSTRFMVDVNTRTIVMENNTADMAIKINGVTGFTGTVLAPSSITVVGGVVTNVS